MTGLAGGQPRMRVGRGGIAGVGDEVGPGGGVGRDLDLVTGDGGAAGAARAVQERSIWVAPLAVAVRPVGAPGALVVVVALSTLDGSPVPLVLMAETR